jgi:hypothetical protein
MQHDFMLHFAMQILLILEANEHTLQLSYDIFILMLFHILSMYATTSYTGCACWKQNKHENAS